MLLNYTDISPIKKSVEVEIPADLIARESERVTREFGSQAKIPGFRPGKVPVSVVRNRFAKEIQEEVMSRLLPATFREARTCLVKKSSFPSRGRIGMPTWLGANAAPM